MNARNTNVTFVCADKPEKRVTLGSALIKTDWRASGNELDVKLDHSKGAVEFVISDAHEVIGRNYDEFE